MAVEAGRGARALRGMKLAVFSHKPCWRSARGGYATDGGFPLQMRAISEMFAETRLAAPAASSGQAAGELALDGHSFSFVPLDPPAGRGIRRKLLLAPWLARNGWTILREARRADAVHAAIPGDIGTFGMLAAWLLRKPLFVRHCGNWTNERTAAERFWKWFMERFAGGRSVMFATGAGEAPPSARNRHIEWIFSTSLLEREMEEMAAGRSREPRPKLIVVCRQERAKGAGIAIEALAIVARELPDATLDVVGDGAALDEFKRAASIFGVGERVTFHGKVGHERVLELLRQASLFCYPTAASEGFPKAVLEALACGLPVIATRVSSLPHLLAGGCGVLLECRSAEALAAAIHECLSDEARYRRMSALAFATAREYTLERWRDAIEAKLTHSWGLHAERA